MTMSSRINDSQDVKAKYMRGEYSAPSCVMRDIVENFHFSRQLSEVFHRGARGDRREKFSI